jgi:hypothetical protein
MRIPGSCYDLAEKRYKWWNPDVKDINKSEEGGGKGGYIEYFR